MTDLTRAPDRYISGAPSEIIDLWFSPEHAHYYFLLGETFRSDVDRADKKLCMLAAVRLGSGEYRVSKTRRTATHRPVKQRKTWMLLPAALREAVIAELSSLWKQMASTAGATMNDHTQESTWH